MNGEWGVVSGSCSTHYSLLTAFVGGAEEVRTPDPLVANQVLSQLSYSHAVLSHSLRPVENVRKAQDPNDLLPVEDRGSGHSRLGHQPDTVLNRQSG